MSLKTIILTTGTITFMLALGAKECRGENLCQLPQSRKYIQELFIPTDLGLLVRKDYDCNNDGKRDMSEMYPVISVDETQKKVYITTHPRGYWIDNNADNKPQDDELYIDNKMNGLSGDEIRQYKQ